MTLIDRLDEYSPQRSVATVTITRAQPFLRSATACRLGSGIEYMAQTIAAHAGYEARLRGAAAGDRFPARHARVPQRRRRVSARRRADDQRRAAWLPTAKLGAFHCAIATRSRRRDGRRQHLPAERPTSSQRLRARSRNAMTRSVLVTGASKGIGAAIAIRARRRTASTIVVHYRSDRAGAERTAEAIRAAGGECAADLQFDVTDRAGSRAAIEADIAAHGAYYGVVNNAGMHRDNAFPLLTRRGLGRGDPHRSRRVLQRAAPVRACR